MSFDDYAIAVATALADEMLNVALNYIESPIRSVYLFWQDNGGYLLAAERDGDLADRDMRLSLLRTRMIEEGATEEDADRYIASTKLGLSIASRLLLITKNT